MGVKVRDLIQLEPDNRRWDFELLKLGRHVRYSRQTKIVLGRREEENRALERMFRREDAPRAALLKPESFVGPTALIVGPCDEAAAQFAAGLLWRYARPSEAGDPLYACLVQGRQTRLLCLQPLALAEAATPL
jgi:tRNA-specific 2-thiouridylase